MKTTSKLTTRLVLVLALARCHGTTNWRIIHINMPKNLRVTAIQRKLKLGNTVRQLHGAARASLPPPST
ncbi:hypothetical protein CUMW_286620 [Citrus unshiu]|uniref:Secreted protein n=1 Tax=Citrus unshiu TaxID=55188 RepID=A0A2H5MYW1_CITUN|nr:hypothetical protein CUMW_286620 [Citrus unshiu]